MTCGKTTGTFAITFVAALSASVEVTAEPVVVEFSVPPGSRPHDGAPAPEGSVWFTAKGAGNVGNSIQKLEAQR